MIELEFHACPKYFLVSHKESIIYFSVYMLFLKMHLLFLSISFLLIWLLGLNSTTWLNEVKAWLFLSNHAKIRHYN
jgi:hypothetical protein